MKTRELVYLFDPLCGWCYGASPRISQLIDDPDFHVTFRPTGLFAREGARVDASLLNMRGKMICVLNRQLDKYLVKPIVKMC